MIVKLGEYIVLLLHRERWNRGAFNVVYGNQLIAKGKR